MKAARHARDTSPVALTLAALGIACASLAAAQVDDEGAAPPAGAAEAALPEGPHVFRTHRGGPELEVVARVPTGSLPKSVTVSPDGTRVVVCNFGQQGEQNVYVYDAETLERTGTITFPGNAVESLFSPDGRTLYVSNFRRHVVEVVDFATLTVEREIRAGHHPKFMALSPDGGTLYVANWAERSVSVLDVAAGQPVRRLRTERHPRGLVVRPDRTLLAAAFHGDVIHVFPESSRAESERWEMCEMPRHLLLSPDAAMLYVTCSMGHIGFYDAQGGRLRGVAPTGRNPRTIAINGDGRWIGVANFTSSDVTLLDTELRQHRTFEVPGASRIVGLAMHPGPRPRIYATSWDTHQLYVLAERAGSQALGVPSAGDAGALDAGDAGALDVGDAGVAGRGPVR